jgi:hypothetical protein
VAVTWLVRTTATRKLMAAARRTTRTSRGSSRNRITRARALSSLGPLALIHPSAQKKSSANFAPRGF